MVKTNIAVNGKKMPCSLTLDGYLHEHLNLFYKKNQAQWDTLLAVTGYEGDGKTQFAMQMALYLDPEFSVKNIVFSLEQFLNLVNSGELPPMSAVVFDESDVVSEHHASATTRTLIRWFKRGRLKNLFIIMVTPTFFDFNKYFIMGGRVSALYTPYAKGLTRGFFAYRNRDTTKKLFIEGKKYWNMDAVAPNKTGRFTKLPSDFPIKTDRDSEYFKKKDSALNTEEENLDVKDRKYYEIRAYRNVYQGLKALGKDIKKQDMAKALGIHINTISGYKLDEKTD